MLKLGKPFEKTVSLYTFQLHTCIKFNKFRLMYGLEFMRLWPAILTTGKAVEVLVLQPPYITYSFALKPGPLNNVFETHIPVDHRISIFQTVEMTSF